MRLELLHAPIMSEKWSSAALIRRNFLAPDSDSVGAGPSHAWTRASPSTAVSTTARAPTSGMRFDRDRKSVIRVTRRSAAPVSLAPRVRVPRQRPPRIGDTDPDDLLNRQVRHGDAPVDEVGREPVEGQRSMRGGCRSLGTDVAQQGTCPVKAEVVAVGASLLFADRPPCRAGAGQVDQPELAFLDLPTEPGVVSAVNISTVPWPRLIASAR